jgi:hypothetical protein
MRPGRLRILVIDQARPDPNANPEVGEGTYATGALAVTVVSVSAARSSTSLSRGAIGITLPRVHQSADSLSLMKNAIYRSYATASAFGGVVAVSTVSASLC